MSSTDEPFNGFSPAGIATATGWSGQTRQEQREARVLVTPRQAWQFSVVPLTRRGHVLEFATSPSRRLRAERFVSHVLCLEPLAHMLDEPTLDACLHALYPPPPAAGLGLRGSRRAMWSSGPE